MAKLKNDPIVLADIHGYLAANDDFAFELRCLRELRKRPITVSHGGTYSDPVTGKSRQFDFRLEIKPEPQLRINVPLECKNLRANFPLLVSRVPRLAQEAFHQVLAPRLSGHVRVQQTDGMVLALNPSETLVMNAPDSIYAEGELVGKSTAQVGRTTGGEFTDDDSEVHEKWAQALASAYDMIAASHHSCQVFVGPRFGVVTIPVVVVPDQMLWAIDYQADGSPKGPPAQIDEAAFFVDHFPWKEHQQFSYLITHLHFVTFTGLLSLVDRILVNPHVWKRLRPPAL